ncbi:MAG: 3-hydroxyacyl-ACP dehydratase FabZ [Paracoccaceae bacterium]|tara:strand:+ start:2359 stop:2814 length:456 start_codon:yes stop_codon:yes gene_type:complete
MNEIESTFSDIEDIQRRIPHRYPFLFIDSVKDIDLNKSAIGVKNVTFNEPHFQGHFPKKPIMPGVTIVEAMAQTSAILVSHSLGTLDEELLVYFMTLDNCRFRKIVSPGDVLELHVSVLRKGSKIWKFQGRAIVDNSVVSEAVFSAMLEKT